MNVAQVREKNAEEYKKFAEFLTMMPKVLLMYSVSYALIRATEPDKVSGERSHGRHGGHNYHPYGWEDEATGQVKTTTASSDKVVHDSSNAAYNWRTSYSGTKAPLDLRNGQHGSVGDKYEYRSNKDRGRARQAGMDRHNIELSKIYQTFFGGGTTTKAKNIKLYNSIYGEYAKNANIEATLGAIKFSAYTGSIAANTVLLGYMNNGIKRSPNAKGLEATITQRFGSI
jgi:hypothetical protein